MQARDLPEIIASGKLRVAIASEEFLPWLGRDGDSAPLGFEVDIATSLAQGLGLQVEFVERPFSDLIAALGAKEADLVVSALSITPERARRVMFSRPYGQTDLELVVDLSRMPEGAEDESYDAEGIRIGVIAGTTSEIEGRHHFDNSEIVTFADRNLARAAFLQGEVNALIAAKPYPEFIVAFDPENFQRAGAPLTSTVEAAAVHPDDHRLLNYVDSWIYQAMASGQLEEATHHWFETLDWVDRIPGLREKVDELYKNEE